MFFTRKGDKGTTTTYGCDQKMSKSSAVAEALGSLDEINSYLGLAKVDSKNKGYKIPAITKTFEQIVHEIQQNLFIVQAEVAGFSMHIDSQKVTDTEKLIEVIESELPPIKTFFISGGSELAALFDTARTIARRAERRVVAVSEEGKVKLGDHTLAYMNRLSSLLYALARYSNHVAGVSEEAPAYK